MSLAVTGPDSGGLDLHRVQETVNRVIAEVSGGSSQWGLADFPRHLNVGDSAIWLGERAALRRAGVRVVASCDKHVYTRGRFARALDDQPILIHGGGNFGDLYPGHHRLRERLLEDFADRPIVQLPQSIHFSSPKALDRTRSLISRHGRVTLMVRDRHSETVAREQFEATVVFVPDAAFALGGLPRPCVARQDIVWLARTDKEQATQPPAPSIDWLARPADLRSRSQLRALEILLAVTSGPAAHRGRGFAPNPANAYDRHARWNVARGLRLLAQGQVVVTDRLHAHILCVLMDLPHVVMADRHGKVRHYWEAWTSAAAHAHWAQDAGEAEEIAAALLRGQTA